MKTMQLLKRISEFCRKDFKMSRCKRCVKSEKSQIVDFHRDTFQIVKCSDETILLKRVTGVQQTGTKCNDRCDRKIVSPLCGNHNSGLGTLRSAFNDSMCSSEPEMLDQTMCRPNIRSNSYKRLDDFSDDFSQICSSDIDSVIKNLSTQQQFLTSQSNKYLNGNNIF